MVSPLPTALWTHTSLRDNECCDVLERYAYTIWSLTKSCRSCQINKRQSRRYGHVPPKTVITNPWECVCVELIGPYTLKGKDNSQIGFMDLTMINPASSWFEIAELPVVEQLHRQTVNGKELLTADESLYKTSERTSLAGLLSPPKCNNFFRVEPLSESRPLIPHYLGELMAFQVNEHSIRLSIPCGSRHCNLLWHWVTHRVVVVSLRKCKDF
jgi:hypothetical protein